MTDCSETEIRDLLPDLCAGNLSDADAAVVEAHVAQCAVCAEEFALLKVVYGMRTTPVHVNVASVVARINAAAVPVSVATDGSPVRSIESAPSKRRSMRTGTWRWAAAITLIAAGGISIAIARHGAGGMLPLAPVDTLLQSDTVRNAATTVAVNTPDSAKPAKGVAARAAWSTERAALSVGELSDLSDTELADVLKNLESWDGAASSDPLVPVPIVKPSGGTQ